MEFGNGYCCSRAVVDEQQFLFQLLSQTSRTLFWVTFCDHPCCRRLDNRAHLVDIAECGTIAL